jgi:EAL domain-containing protein (putative c-di-GMP-specific phosphodiesterase class I)/GGDEF domain-containing protein
MPREHVGTEKRLFQAMKQRQLGMLFQPVIELSSSHIIGYEGQVRGPSDSLLHSPQCLLRVAKQVGALLDLEHLCCQLAVDGFIELELAGWLFLKLHAHVFSEHKFKEVQLPAIVEKAGLTPQQVVVTLYVHEPHDHVAPNLLPKIISRYTELGYRVCLDDQGEIFCPRQSPPRIFPFCVKLNRYLLQDIDKDPTKVQLLKSLQKYAGGVGFLTLAEGIESRSELMLAKAIGISFAQGGFISKPSKQPIRVMPREVAGILLSDDYVASMPYQHKGIDAVLELAPHFTVENNNEEVFRAFEQSPQLSVVAVTNNRLPVGLINRYVFINRYARPYQRELYGKKSCATFMDPEPLVVDRNISLQELSRLLAEEQRHVSLGFIFTENGLYLGVGTSQKLIHIITELQIQSARYANPLTGLPGNVTIEKQIDALLASETPFCVCYFDLDNFKPFNDVYGFARGDAMIQMTAKAIAGHCDPELDFVGHIGGDDFIVLFRSTDWEARCHAMLETFGVVVVSFFDPGDLERGGYVTENRRDEKEFHKLTSLSVGAVPVKPKEFKSRHDIAVVAAESKKMAKKMPDNSLFINRRNYSGLTNKSG